MISQSLWLNPLLQPPKIVLIQHPDQRTRDNSLRHCICLCLLYLSADLDLRTSRGEILSNEERVQNTHSFLSRELALRCSSNLISIVMRISRSPRFTSVSKCENFEELAHCGQCSLRDIWARTKSFVRRIEAIFLTRNSHRICTEIFWQEVISTYFQRRSI